MIDEKLYQLATDELNSDKRKADIWARACALASNDHDEARYLYTNLRVEQMLAEQTQKDKELARSGGVPDAELTLADDELMPAEPDSAADAQPQHASTGGSESALDDGLMSDFDLDPEDVAAMNAAQSGKISEIHGNLSTDKSGTGAKPEISMEDNPLAYWSAQHQQHVESSDGGEDALSQELERQVSDLPGQQSDIVFYKSLDDSPVFEDSPSDVMADNAQITADPDAAHPNNGADAPVNYDYAEDHYDEPDDEPKLVPGTGKRYQVYSRRGRLLAVKDGVSWPAMLFTLPWLITRSMFGTAIVYIVLWAVIIAGLLTTGFAWMDAGDQASTAIKVWTGVFGLLAFIALMYLPFRHGNKWVGSKLIKRGFKLESFVYAKSRKEAVNLALNSAAF